MRVFYSQGDRAATATICTRNVFTSQYMHSLSSKCFFTYLLACLALVFPSEFYYINTLPTPPIPLHLCNKNFQNTAIPLFKTLIISHRTIASSSHSKGNEAITNITMKAHALTLEDSSQTDVHCAKPILAGRILGDRRYNAKNIHSILS